MKTTVTKVSPDGTQEPFCVFVNRFSPRYNLVTLCMQMHRDGNVMVEERRKLYDGKIQEARHTYFFEFNGNVYITKKQQQ